MENSTLMGNKHIETSAEHQFCKKNHFCCGTLHSNVLDDLKLGALFGWLFIL